MRILALAVLAVLTAASQAWAGGPPSVPEPAALALLAVGVSGVALVRFRRRK